MARLVKRTPQEPSKPGKLYWYDDAGKRHEVADAFGGIRTF